MVARWGSRLPLLAVCLCLVVVGCDDDDDDDSCWAYCDKGLECMGEELFEQYLGSVEECADMCRGGFDNSEEGRCELSCSTDQQCADWSVCLSECYLDELEDPCPGYEGYDDCCQNADPCHYADDGFCDCDTCSWDEADCASW